MKLVMLFGPQAVGKMTVGQELSKITKLKLFHNHMTIELLAPFFNFTSEMWEISDSIRSQVFQAFAKTKQEGLIFTLMWAFNLEADWDFVRRTVKIFKDSGAEVYFVELEADLEERLKRNVTPNRLEEKPTKRNTEFSRKELLSSMEKYRLNSNEGEMTEKNYLRINNTEMTAQEVAEKIKEEFRL
ncbi:shikimate kinase [Alkalihalobacillus sp. 1P02AB]|uniref:shikimate kinase n=1 Tax=Alkalihalobacillus sp. 1P02AB TaxID=3132260 RepID=UPI0039A6B8CD